MQQLIALSLCLTLGAPLKVHVDGEGYLRFLRQGRVVFARQASLAAENGYLAFGDALVLPKVQVPGDASDIKVDLMGNVSAHSGSGDRVIGHLIVALFPKGSNAEAQGKFLVFEDRPELSNPGDGEAGVVRTDADNPTPPAPSKGGSLKTVAAPERVVAQRPKVKSVVGQKPQVVIHPLSEIVGDTYCLSDIADISGDPTQVGLIKNLKIGNTPILGVTRIIDQKAIRLKLLGADLKPENFIVVIPANAEVVRKSQTIEAQVLVDRAIAAVHKRFGDSIPLGSSQVVRPVQVTGDAFEVQASEPMKSGTGYYVVVSVKVGQQIEATRTVMLAPSADAECVHVGDPVTVYMKAGAASVEVRGKVKTAGYVGQRVQVSVSGISDKPTIHEGVVVSADRVEVQL